MTYWKAVREDGADFHSGTVRWAPESGDIPAEGLVVTHPTSTEWGDYHSTHLCASTSPTDCTGFTWPCRLLEVEPVSEVHEHEGCKMSALSWRVVHELPAMQALGPQGEAVVALLDGLRRLDAEALARLRLVRRSIHGYGRRRTQTPLSQSPLQSDISTDVLVGPQMLNSKLQMNQNIRWLEFGI